MRHPTRALRHVLTDPARPLRRLRANITFIAVSLLVPLVALGALAVPPRVAHEIAAPLWNAVAEPLEQLGTTQIPGAPREASVARYASNEPEARRLVRATVEHSGVGASRGAGGGRADDRSENGGEESRGGAPAGADDDTGTGGPWGGSAPPSGASDDDSGAPGVDDGGDNGVDEGNRDDGKDPHDPAKGGASAGNGNDSDDGEGEGRGNGRGKAKGNETVPGKGNGGANDEHGKPRHGDGGSPGASGGGDPPATPGDEHERGNAHDSAHGGPPRGTDGNGLGHPHGRLARAAVETRA